MAPGRTRRAVLVAVGGALGTLAGCAQRPDDGTTPGSTDGDSPSDDAGPPTDSGTPTDGSTPGPSLPVDGRWPQAGFDAGHAGVAQATGVPRSGTPYWHHRRIRSGPAVLADGRLFHYAELGADPGGTPTPTSTPPTGTAHPVEGNPHLVARDAATGDLEWWTPLAERAGGWAAVGRNRVFATGGGEVFAADVYDGSRRWTDDLPPADHPEADSFPRPVGDPTLVGDALVVPLPGVVDRKEEDYLAVPRVRAYALDGSRRWTVRLSKRNLGVAATDDVAVVVAADWGETAVVTARDLADGSERWRTEIPATYFRGPVVADGAVFVGSSGGPVHALSLADGSERWTQATPGSPPALAADGSAVYVAAGQRFLALDAADGSERWRVGEEDQAYYVAPPSVGGGVVYAGGTGNEAPLRALDAASGEERWRHRFPTTTVEGDMVMSGVRTQPTVADGAVYVDAVDGLYGFGSDAA